ncbi:MAG TPA: RluA family pseudouridine synthase [Thermomicrobiales bacterium]|nr:RluA family pseudouridine synthase [Thermomicrobiales bacterium]
MTDEPEINDSADMAYFELSPDISQRNERLDRYIASELPNLSRSGVQALIEAGHVLVDCQRRKASFKVTPGEVVAVSVPPLAPDDVEPEDIPLEILYEDADVIVINKAAGMVVHPAPGHASGTLVNALRFHAIEIAELDSSRTGIVHRLDKDTSGVMIVGKHNRAVQFLQDQWLDGSVDKRYVAIAFRAFAEEEAVIDVPIARHRTERKRMDAGREGREALTIASVRERFPKATLLDVDLQTGRTHQIRVHLAFIKHPVLGDTVYGTQSSTAYSRELGARRQMLHAASLTVELPVGGGPRTFTASLPFDIRGVLDKLRAMKEQDDG